MGFSGGLDKAGDMNRPRLGPLFWVILAKMSQNGSFWHLVMIWTDPALEGLGSLWEYLTQT